MKLLDIGLVILSSDFRVVGTNDHARRVFGPALDDMGRSLFHYHPEKSRGKLRGLLQEMGQTPRGLPKTMIIDVLGMAVMYNLSRLSIALPTEQTYWSVAFIDVSEQTCAEKNPDSGLVEMRKIPVLDGENYRFLSTDSVHCIESDGDYCKLFTNERMYYVHMSLKTVLLRYPAAGFFRAHKSFIVNLSRVASVVRSTGQAQAVFDDTALPPVPVSRRMAAPLKKALTLR